MYDDPTGHFFNVAAALVGAAVGAVVGAGIEMISDAAKGKLSKSNWKKYAGAAAAGAITGATAGFTGGASLVARAAIQASAGYGGSVSQQYISTGKVNHKKAAVTGLVSGATYGAVSKATNLFKSSKPAVKMSSSSNKVTNKALHKNSNDYVGHQGVYEIKINKNLHKYGKAYMTQIVTSTGNPKRLQTQINKLQRQNPNSIVAGKVIYENKNISTANIKKVETNAIQKYYDKNKKFPPGNLNHPGIKK
jgi:hypothetical protein